MGLLTSLRLPPHPHFQQEEQNLKPKGSPQGNTASELTLVACCVALCIAASPAQLLGEIQRSDLKGGESLGKASVVEKEEGKHFKVVSN